MAAFELSWKPKEGPMSAMDGDGIGTELVESRGQEGRCSRSLQDWPDVDSSAIRRPIDLTK